MRISWGARALAAVAAATATLLLPVPAHAAQAGTVGLVDVAPDGTPGNGLVGGSDISDDGRYVAFASSSTNLVPDGGDGDTNSVFVRDTLTGTTALASGGLDGQPANGDAVFTAKISGNGRYVVFTSYASNLVPNDVNDNRDVFVYDRQTGTTALASTFADGRQIQGISDGATISDNGRYVAFVTTAFGVVDDQGDYLNGQVALVHDMKTGRTTTIDVPGDGGFTNTVFAAAISGNGKLVAFSGFGDWIGDGGTGTGIFVRDLSSGATVRANKPAAGDTLPDGTDPTISKDGTRVTWNTYEPYVAEDTNGTGDVYVRDLVTDTTALVSANRAGTGAANLGGEFGNVAAGGRYVAFYSQSTDIVAHDANGTAEDVFVRDLQTGKTVAASSSASGATGNSDSFDGSVSSNGSRVVFVSAATDLGVDPGDGQRHLFLRCLRACVTGQNS